jgi:peptidoglycan/LPS O-acetylase OafA/YrhL
LEQIYTRHGQLSRLKNLKNINTYRPDIDGLRALAVLSVVLFHIDPSNLPGGFLGVDIFFVISGYLITKIILTQMNDSNFSYIVFYTRRVKRLLPPLFFMLFFSCCIGYFILLPYDFYKFGISIASVLGFASNIQYSLRSDDYFSTNSTEWPLLHTWSLAVEEQYYFILPLLILTIYKLAKSKLITIFCTIAITSFVVAEFLSRSDHYSSISYYLITTRMGELLVGSILAASQIKNKIQSIDSNLVTFMSFILIIVLLICVDKSLPFPGILALALCVPVAILINSHNTFVNKLLSIKPIVLIGLMSYSLYLVHWPILAFSRYLFNFEKGMLQFTLTEQLILAVVIFAISMFSYNVIEKPLRHIKISSKKVFVFYFFIPTTIFACLSLFIISTNGALFRLDSDNFKPELQFGHIDKTVCPDLVNIGCLGGDKNSNELVILYGNSHAEHYFEYLSLIGKEQKFRVELIATGGCGPTNMSRKCAYVKDEFKKAKETTKNIVIAYRWDTLYEVEEDTNELESMTQSLVEEGKFVTILAQPPILEIDPSKLINCQRVFSNCAGEFRFKDKNAENYNEKIKNIALSNGARFIDPFDKLTDKYQFRDGAHFYYSDFDHLSVYGAMWLYDERDRNTKWFFE